MRRDNRGFSLVELLVAITIAAIISGSIAYLLRTSLHLYGNETTDVVLQQELQVTLNQIMDYAMESQEVLVSGSSSSTDYITLGTIIPKAGAEKAKLDAQIIWWDNADKKLYLKKEIIPEIEKETENGTLPATVEGIISAIPSADNYLLAEYVSDFNVSVNGIVTGTTNYKNPVSLDINLAFTKKGSSRDIEKKVSDKAVLRNRLKLPIIVVTDGTAKTYKLLSESTKLNKITESVDMPQQLYGDVHYVQHGDPGSSGGSSKITVIEVVPKPGFGLLSYLVGGKEPIDSDGMDAAANQTIGCMPYDNPQDGVLNNVQQLLNTSTEGANKTNILTGSGEYSGYFEKVSFNDDKVRRGRGGVYALNKDRDINDFSNITFKSEYTNYDTNRYNKSDFCWVWRELTDYNFDEDGFYYDGEGNYAYKYNQSEIENAPVGARIYLRKCKKKKVVNNEMFILYCLGLDKSNGAFGLYESIAAQPSFYHNNKLEVDKFDKDNLEIFTYTPLELASHQEELNRADLIFFMAGSDGLYNDAITLAKFEEPEKCEAVRNLSCDYVNDITFSQMKFIYEKVVNSKLGIVTSRTTYLNNVERNAANIPNMNSLFYMLFRMSNDNIVCSDGEFYGTDENKYYINDANKVDEIKKKDSSATRWSGRMMFTDFFTSNFESSSKAAYSYKNLIEEGKFSKPGGGYYSSADFIHYDESNGKITLGPQTSYKGRSWSSSSFNNWKGNIFGDKNNFAQGYGSGSLSFLINDYYAQLGFRVADENLIGQWANQAMFENDGQFIRYSSNAPQGSLGLIGKVVTATKDDSSYENPSEVPTNDAIGRIEVVGYGVGKNIANSLYEGGKDEGRYYIDPSIANPTAADIKTVPDNPESHTYEYWLEHGMSYQHRFEDFANNKGKGMYLTDAEYWQAREFDNGIYVYIVVWSSFDVAQDPKYYPYLSYDLNEYSSATYDVSAADADGVVRYAPGDGVNEDYVTEFKIHMSSLYFYNPWEDIVRFYPPSNYANNRITAMIGDTSHLSTQNKEIEGSEKFKITVRDMFSLD